MTHTPKQRMLNAYRGIRSDRVPVAPEFWYYYPAKVLGVDMIEFEREIPLWQALQATFTKYSTEGWGVVFAGTSNGLFTTKSSLKAISDGRYEETIIRKLGSNEFVSRRVFDRNEPSWTVEHPVKDMSCLMEYALAGVAERIEFDFSQTVAAWDKVGEDYLLELWLGVPFFDFVACMTGFEEAIMLFADESVRAQLMNLREAHTAHVLKLVDRACSNTKFESFAIGCSYSCNSLIGPEMWRMWDKPFIKRVADELHRHERLLHVHFHGRCMETVCDFAEIDIDCVCPFERPPGGDVDGLPGLREVREGLAGKTTMNGNVHTVETLIRGTPEDVRREVSEIREAFRDEPRLIIGTGDQVGRETPEQNIMAMLS